MHDWKEQRAAGGAAWEQWYQAKLVEIVRLVESDENRRFAGEIETLNGHLKLIPDYRKLLLTLAEIADLDRKDAAELFDYFLANPLRSVIHGGRERYLIVIDALDEAGEAGRNPLVEMLARNAQRLSGWLGDEPLFGSN